MKWVVMCNGYVFMYSDDEDYAESVMMRLKKQYSDVYVKRAV